MMLRQLFGSRWRYLLALVACIPGVIGAEERVFQFIGTLEDAPNCAPPDDPMCAKYVGTLKIDDKNIGIEILPTFQFFYPFNEAKVVFADGQIASSSSPSIPVSETEMSSGLRVTKYWDGTLEILIQLGHSTPGFGAISPSYIFDPETFEPTDLSDILDAFPGKPKFSRTWIVGGACSWGCLDRSLGTLTPLSVDTSTTHADESATKRQ